MKMNHEKEDLRVKRTKKSIYEAFIALVNDKGFDAITIQEIADYAMINRTTFYAHFQDKHDLADQILLRTFERLGESKNYELMNENGQIQLTDIHDTITNMLLNIKKEAHFYSLVLDNIDLAVLKRYFTQFIRNQYKDIVKRLKIMEQDMEIPLEVVGEYSASIFLSLIRWWLDHDMEYPEDKLAHLLIKLIGNANLTILGIEILQ